MNDIGDAGFAGIGEAWSGPWHELHKHLAAGIDPDTASEHEAVWGRRSHGLKQIAAVLSAYRHIGGAGSELHMARRTAHEQSRSGSRHTDEPFGVGMAPGLRVERCRALRLSGLGGKHESERQSFGHGAPAGRSQRSAQGADYGQDRAPRRQHSRPGLTLSLIHISE